MATKTAYRVSYTPTIPTEGSRQFDLLCEMARNSRRWVSGENSRTTSDHTSITDDISRLRAKGWGFEEKIVDSTTGRTAYRLDQQRWNRIKAKINRFWTNR